MVFTGKSTDLITINKKTVNDNDLKIEIQFSSVEGNLICVAQKLIFRMFFKSFLFFMINVIILNTFLTKTKRLKCC